jgi:cyclic beta-1,2-glucan synthetase
MSPAHEGRGGWSWYTGSAGWMQRAGMENILGVRVLAGSLHLAPCIPKDWPEFSVTLRHGTARYDVRVSNPSRVCRGIAEVTLDGSPLLAPPGGRPLVVPLIDDGQTHRLDVTMGPATPA